MVCLLKNQTLGTSASRIGSGDNPELVTRSTSVVDATVIQHNTQAPTKARKVVRAVRATSVT